MEKFEIKIGKVFDLSINTTIAKQTLIITIEQLEVIKYFANTKKDSELNTIYKINDCEFTVVPFIDLNGN